MGFLFYCSSSHSASHLFYKLGCMYAASGGNPVWDCCSCRPGALSPFILCCSASPQKVSLGSCNESLFHSRRAEVIDSGRAALCFLSGRRGGEESNMAAPAARATSLSTLSPFRYHPHPSCSLKALFLLRRRRLKRAPTNLI